MTILPALAASLLASAAWPQDKADERTKRILERVEKEIQESNDRLREEIRAIIRAEVARAGGKPATAPPPAARKKVLLGVTADDLTDAERKALGIGGGIKVGAVRGPAEQAGLKPGDILLELGGAPVTEETIGQTLEKYQPGDSAELLVLRGGKRTPLKIVLAERKE
jgi:S1-C subfamily serine protease